MGVFALFALNQAFRRRGTPPARPPAPEPIPMPVPEPELHVSAARPPRTMAQFTKEELKQLGLTRRYLLSQEEHKRSVLPGIVTDTWRVIADPGSTPPQLFKFNEMEHPNDAVNRALADPVAYWASIPSANAVAKILYNHASIGKLRKDSKGQRTIPTPSMMLRGAKKEARGQERDIMRSLGYSVPISGDKRVLCAEINLRVRSILADPDWQYLENEYVKRRQAIYQVLEALPATPRSELEYHELFNILLVIERNWTLLLGLLCELLVLSGAASQMLNGPAGLAYVRSTGANKMAKEELRQAFTRNLFDWGVVKTGLGLQAP